MFEKTCATTKNVKSRVLGFKKNIKNVGFRGNLITPVFNTQLPKLTRPTVSHQHETSLLRNADVVFTFTRNYAI